MLRGRARSERGELDEGLKDVKDGLRSWEAVGATLARPYFQASVAETYLAVKRRDEGLSILDVATRDALELEQAWWLPEHYRLRGELLQLEPGNEAEAEQSLDAGLAQAREQGALSLELRCAMGLHRLLVAAGRAAEGRDRLRAVYDRFTEGFGSTELVLAREALA